MSLQKIKDELLKIWPNGSKCEHTHAAKAFKLLDELIEEEKEPKRYFNDGKKP